MSGRYLRVVLSTVGADLLDALPVLYRDETITAALPYARGDDRSVLIGALRSSRGETGVPFLRRVLMEKGSGTGHNRAVALAVLAARLGAEGTPLYADALDDRAVAVQISAVMALAEDGDGRAAPQVLAWLLRKLRRRNRLASWDPRELPAPITYAARNRYLPQVAVVLEENLTRLHRHEHDWLASAWPEVADRQAGDHPPAPDARQLDAWLYEAGGRLEVEKREAVLATRDGYVQKALGRAQRRASPDQAT